jgi:UDP-N-acetyl-D-mannosaminuronic acid dehydrogenase
MGEGVYKYDLCIIGGAGHVGLPFGVAFANSGIKTVLLDVNKEALEKIQKGVFPFEEYGGDEALKSALEKNTLSGTESPEVIKDSEYVVIIIGTPIDEYLSPDFRGISRLVDTYLDYFRDNQIVILRSTVYPGTTEKIQRYFQSKGKKVRLSFCPERIMQGHGIIETKSLTQIVSAFDMQTLDDVTALFKKISTATIVPVMPIEAELAKLFTNSWRYIRFAVANQFYMIAKENGLDYHKIHYAMNKDYPRNRDLPSPGFAAGPCLFKDTMQLAAYTNNNFWLGHAAMLVNEGLAGFIIHSLREEFKDAFKEKTIGILGMAFKANLDDPRDSLSYKLRKIAHLECKKVLCTDSHIKDPSFVSLEELLKESDIIILATPHSEYEKIKPRDFPDKKFVDVWNFWGMSEGPSGSSVFSA